MIHKDLQMLTDRVTKTLTAISQRLAELGEGELSAATEAQCIAKVAKGGAPLTTCLDMLTRALAQAKKKRRPMFP